MEWVETTAETVEAAKDLALDRLGVHSDEAEFEIVEDRPAKLFGLRSGRARVRARVRPRPPRTKEGGRQRRQRRGGRAGRDGSTASKRSGRGQGRSVDRGGARPSKGDKPRKRQPSPDRESAKTAGGPHPTEAKSAAGEQPPASAQIEPRRRRSGRGETNKKAEKTPTSSAKQEKQEAMHDDDESTVGPRDQGEIIATFLEGVLDSFGMDADVLVGEVVDDTCAVDVTGDDLGLLIGPRGDTIRALHEISRTVVQRESDGRPTGRVRIDVGGYFAKRRSALEEFARKLAAQVRDEQVEKALEPMNAADRKIVHDAITDIEGVRSTSEGDEPNRRVVLLPSDD